MFIIHAASEWLYWGKHRYLEFQRNLNIDFHPILHIAHCPYHQNAHCLKIREKRENGSNLKWHQPNQFLFEWGNIVFVRKKAYSIKDFAVFKVAEVVRRHGGPSPKSFDSDKNLSTNIRYFVRILRFAVIYALFVRLGGKKVFFLAQQRRILSKSALLHGLYWISYWIISANLNYAQKQRACCENSKYTPNENFYGPFCPRRKAANFWLQKSRRSRRLGNLIKRHLKDRWSATCLMSRRTTTRESLQSDWGIWMQWQIWFL